MVQVIQAQNINLAYLQENFKLKKSDSEDFFSEWLLNLPEITDSEKTILDRVKANFLHLIMQPPFLENALKMVVLSPLLDLAGFYNNPFYLATEKAIELAVQDKDEIVRGRIDILVVQQQLWLLVVESKKASFSLLEAIPQALTYMLNNSDKQKLVFGLVTNGSHFTFLKLTIQDKPVYATSDEFTLFRRQNELYRVLSILKNLGSIIS
ncbi:restriction endonuclease subunit R [Plectonema cf. radiosum LEGE 06105]|uniref:Restriction endonuclease subunit R n=1 Tax=Plectonema cf. radiosum LEGE 06105 TaxID=945769 RepID=A0A8J7JTP6_9CYAN|nr:type I restriction endonuclease [Plectonema radiosum]MBE9214019.1 restriction endonuclease subunit R [Plectonema cf. radiosum LEGE 06105]